MLSQTFFTLFNRHSGQAGVIPAFAGRRDPESRPGKGTGNFFEDEKVASPQLDARFRGHDGRETTEFVCELLGQESRSQELESFKLVHFSGSYCKLSRIRFEMPRAMGRRISSPTWARPPRARPRIAKLFDICQ